MLAAQCTQESKAAAGVYLLQKLWRYNALYNCQSFIYFILIYIYIIY